MLSWANQSTTQQTIGSVAGFFRAGRLLVPSPKRNWAMTREIVLLYDPLRRKTSSFSLIHFWPGSAGRIRKPTICLYTSLYPCQLHTCNPTTREEEEPTPKRGSNQINKYPIRKEWRKKERKKKISLLTDSPALQRRVAAELLASFNSEGPEPIIDQTNPCSFFL